MEKYIKTLENQDLNDFFLEILTWINYRQLQLIPNNEELSLFPKICCFRESCCLGKLLQWKLSLNMEKKNLGVRKKVKFQMDNNSPFNFTITHQTYHLKVILQKNICGCPVSFKHCDPLVLVSK